MIEVHDVIGVEEAKGKVAELAVGGWRIVGFTYAGEWTREGYGAPAPAEVPHDRRRFVIVAQREADGPAGEEPEPEGVSMSYRRYLANWLNLAADELPSRAHTLRQAAKVVLMGPDA